jgi:hypothetical protein
VTTQLADVRAAIAALRALPEVDPARVAVTGSSYGGILTLLAAEADGTLRAAVAFAPAAMNWRWNAPLRERLLDGRAAHARADARRAGGERLERRPHRGHPRGDARGRRRRRGAALPGDGAQRERGARADGRRAGALADEVFAFLARHLAPAAGPARATLTGGRP